MTQTPLPPTFAKHSADSPTFWDLRYEAAFTPWSQANLPQSWLRFLNAQTNALAIPQMHVLVPGCGEGFEVADLVQRGYNTTAIDFSHAAIAAAQKGLGTIAQLPNCHLHQADFFSADVGAQQFDLVYERAFLCSLPPSRRQEYAAQMAKIIKPHGLLAGFFCYDPTPKGPPFGLAANGLEALFNGHFQRIENEAPTDSIAVFAGREQFEVWRRLA